MRPDFAEAYDEHVWQVYAFLAYRCANRSDAEDLTQMTFERALRAWHRYDERRASLLTWLMTIARNLLIDFYRADRTSGQETLDAMGPREPSAEEAYDLGLAPELAAALGELSARDAEVVALRFGGDLTGPEIADMLDLSLANVQQILSRSLRKLRARMEDLESASA